MKNTIIRKLSSRKLWVAIATFISGLIIACNGDATTAETVSGLIMSGGSMIAYIVAEGFADGNNGGGKDENDK